MQAYHLVTLTNSHTFFLLSYIRFFAILHLRKVSRGLCHQLRGRLVSRIITEPPERYLYTMQVHYITNQEVCGGIGQMKMIFKFGEDELHRSPMVALNTLKAFCDVRRQL